MKIVTLGYNATEWQRSSSEYHFRPRKQWISIVFLTTDSAQRGIFPIQWFIPLRPQLINSLMEFKT